jgi:hypothetical protein
MDEVNDEYIPESAGNDVVPRWHRAALDAVSSPAGQDRRGVVAAQGYVRRPGRSDGRRGRAKKGEQSMADIHETSDGLTVTFSAHSPEATHWMLHIYGTPTMMFDLQDRLDARRAQEFRAAAQRLEPGKGRLMIGPM